MHKHGLLVVLILSCQSIIAQKVIGFSSEWNDMLTEWNIICVQEEDDGRLIMRNPDYPLDWDIEWADKYGTIKQLFEGKREKWVLRLGNDYLEFKPRWPGQRREWKLTDHTHTLYFKSKWANIPDEWNGGQENLGYFDMQTDQTGDIRDWEIDDDLVDGISPSFKMAMLFIAIHSVAIQQ